MHKNADSKCVLVNDSGHVVGQDHHRAKLTDHDVWLILELRADGMHLGLIAEKFDISKSQACYICSGKRRGQLAVGQKWLAPPHRLRFTSAKPDDFELVHISW